MISNRSRVSRTPVYVNSAPMCTLSCPRKSPRRWDARSQPPSILSTRLWLPRIPWRYQCREPSAPCDSSGAVSHLSYPLLASAVRATVHSPICLYAVTEDSAATMATGRGKRLNGALKAIEGMRHVSHNYLKSLIIVVPAGFTLCHGNGSSHLACVLPRVEVDTSLMLKAGSISHATLPLGPLLSDSWQCHSGGYRATRLSALSQCETASSRNERMVGRERAGYRGA